VERREFIKLSGVSLFSSNLLNNVNSIIYAQQKENVSSDSLFQNLVRLNDHLCQELMKRQELDKSHPWFGGVLDDYEIHTTGGTAEFIKVMISAYVSPESEFYKSDSLIERMNYASLYLLKAQHEDGTIDLLTTNFHSTPDTGFVLEPLCIGLFVLNRLSSSQTKNVKENLKKFILKAGDALSVGGIHTPNHRWVVCMALSRIYSLFPNEKYLNRIEEWLLEKIDIDADGQFSEKSASIYNPLTDRCLITIARFLNKPELLNAVHRNLDMSIYYVHADGELVTAASKRQDQYQRGSMASYYYSYRYMAIQEKNGQFAAMARWIEKTASKNLVWFLIFFLEDQILNQQMPDNVDLPTDYEKIFIHSDLVRIRREQVSATIIANNPHFFSFMKGKAGLESIRFASAFFGKGQFKGRALEIQNGKYILRQQLAGPYYQPFPKEKLPGDGDWNKMDRSLRPQSEIQHYEAVVTIMEKDGKFELTFDVGSTDNIPLSIELGFRHSGKLLGVEKIPEVEHGFILKQGFGKYIFENETIEFGPGKKEHSWTQLRGALPNFDGLSVYLTSFTPFIFKLQIF